MLIIYISFFFMFSIVDKDSAEISSRRLEAAQYTNNVEEDFLSRTVFNTIEEVNKSAEVSLFVNILLTYCIYNIWIYNESIVSCFRLKLLLLRALS